MQERDSGAETLQAPILRGLNLPWKEVLRLGSRFTLSAGSPLHLFGPALLDFYYLQRGDLRLMHSAEDGSERTILQLSTGVLFNEASCLLGYDAPDCCFNAAKDCEIYRFPGTLLTSPQFISQHPELIVNVMRSQARKILIMHVGLGNTVGRSALSRVSRLILALCRQHGNSLCFDPALSQQDVARTLGMHRASVVRAIADLRKLGAIRQFTKRSLEIGNLELLCKLADE